MWRIRLMMPIEIRTWQISTLASVIVSTSYHDMYSFVVRNWHRTLGRLLMMIWSALSLSISHSLSLAPSLSFSPALWKRNRTEHWQGCTWCVYICTHNLSLMALCSTGVLACFFYAQAFSRDDHTSFALICLGLVMVRVALLVRGSNWRSYRALLERWVWGLLVNLTVSLALLHSQLCSTQKHSNYSQTSFEEPADSINA